MTLRAISIRAACLFVPLLIAAESRPQKVKWTGWFSDATCAAAHAATGDFTATNPECSRRCIEKGIAPVFISEQAQALFQIKGYPSVADDLGYHMEVEGLVDESAKTITVQKTTRLGSAGAACGRPRKTASKK
jgi:hypothetical protein